MSLATDKLDVVKVVDPRVSFPEWSMPVREGGNTISYLRTSASSTGNTVTFNVVPPNPGGSVIGRDMLVYNKITFTVTGVAPAGGGNLVNIGSTDASRAFPWTSCVDTMSLQINNETITQGNWAEVGHVLRRFNPRSSLYKLSNFCPWFPDQSAKYSDLVGTNRNVLSAGAVGDYDFLRGAYARIYTTASTAVGATIVLETYEPINLSPFLYGSKAPGIPFVQTMALTFNASKYERALSRAVDDVRIANFTSISAVCSDSQLYYQSIAVPLLEGAIPRSVSLPTYKLMINTTSGMVTSSAVSAGLLPSGKALTSQVINYPCIPSRIYVFAQPVHSSKTYATPDFTYMFTGGLSVQWGARTSLMTSVQREQLYTQAVECGFSSPWEQFDGRFRLQSGTIAGSSGSVLCIRPGVDFDLAPGEVSGLAGSWQFQVSGNFHDQSNAGNGADVNCVLYVVAVLNGVLTLTSGFETHQVIGAISQADVLDAKQKISSESVIDHYGAGFLDNIKSMVAKALPTIQHIGKVAHAGLSMANNAGLLGSGASSGGDMGVASYYGSGAYAGGSAFSGGARLSKKDLSARLR